VLKEGIVGIKEGVAHEQGNNSLLHECL